jgi:hypothetical protein
MFLQCLNVQFCLQCSQIFFLAVRPESPRIRTQGAILDSEAFVIHATMWTRLATPSCVLLVRRVLVE